MARIAFATDEVPYTNGFGYWFITVKKARLARIAFATNDDWIESLSDRLGKPAQSRRLKSSQRNGKYLRKLLILLGLFVFASGLSLISSNFGDLTSSF